MRHRAVREASDEMGAYARLYGGIEERLTAAEDLRANGAGVHAMWRFVEDSSGMLRSSVRRQRAFIRMWWAVQGAVTAGSVLSLVVSATLVANGAITLGTAFLLFQYVLLMSRPLEDLVHQLETVQKANGAMVRVIDLLAVRGHDRRRRHDVAAAGALAVSCRGVSFTYADGDRLDGPRRRRRRRHGDEQTILHDLDLDIAPGRSVGVVGRTGSGKTTFSRLLLRLVEATDGTVCARRRADRRHPAGRAAPPRRPRAPGGRAVRGHDPRQRHAVRPGADRRRRRGRAASTSASAPSSPPASTAPSGPAAPGCRPARPSCWRSPGCGCASPTSSCSTRPRRASTR